MKTGALIAGTVLLAAIATPALPTEPEPAMTVPLCSTCLNPSLSSIGGQGSHEARLSAHIVPADAARWCATYQQGGAGCVDAIMARRETYTSYGAKADCPAGTITTLDQVTFTTVLGTDGRKVWRDDTGGIAGQGGRGDPAIITAQWDMLCPTGAPGPGRMPNGGAMRAHFALGQFVEVQHDRVWWSGYIVSVRMKHRQTGSELLYEVKYENGGRAFLPEWRLHALEGRRVPRSD